MVQFKVADVSTVKGPPLDGRATDWVFGMDSTAESIELLNTTHGLR